MGLQPTDASVDPCEPRAARETRALIAHILERYHAVHRRELRDLHRLAREVESVHRSHPDCPAGLADFLAETLGELGAHMDKEEQVLFPLLLAGGGACAPFAIRRMRHEHDEHGDRLEALRRRTQSFAAPEGACEAWRSLYAGCRKLHDDLREHIRLENDLLFPAFE